MILKGPVQPFTHHSPLSSKLIIVIVFSMINLLISFPITSIQEINQRGQGSIITVVPRLRGQSSSTAVAPRIHTRSNPVVHMLDVWLQSRLVRGRRVRSTLDLKISVFSFLTILWGNLTWTAFTEDLLMCSYTRYVCQLLQLFRHLRLDIDVVTHLPECFVEPGILF